jgi:ankyrin repeat protein
MIGIFTRPLIVRAVAFTGTLMLSLGVVGSLPKFKERRQKYFLEAATDGNVRRMQWLHLAGVNVNARDGSQPLLLAAREGQVKAVRYLLDHGADIDARDRNGNSAISEAAYYGQIPIIKELSARGADINSLSNAGTPLDIALNRNNDTVADLIKHYGGRRANELH